MPKAAASQDPANHPLPAAVHAGDGGGDDDDAPEDVSFAAAAAAARSVAAPAFASRKRRRAAAVAVRPVLSIAPISADVLAALDLPPVPRAAAHAGALADLPDAAEEERARRRRARARARDAAAEADAEQRVVVTVKDGIRVQVEPGHRGERFGEAAHDGAADVAAAAARAAAAGFVHAHLFGARLRRVGGAGGGRGRRGGGDGAAARRARGVPVRGFARAAT